jgi:pyruvate/2-oxoglutarate dehydrogenase complex dihydrolipoamide dehydrogenase (E3) component
MSHPEEYDVVVLGRGEAGKYLAWTLAKKGMRVVVIERKYIGGSCPNVACMPSKNVIHSAKVASYFCRSGEFGITKGNKIPMVTVYRARTLVETRGFLKALIDTESDRILGFTALGAEAGEIIAVVQVAMLAGLPYTALRDAIFTHPTMVEGLIPLFSAVPARPQKIT